jgi:uncharacterized protein (TIRG00374 family)
VTSAPASTERVAGLVAGLVAALVLVALLVLALLQLDLGRVGVELSRARPAWIIAALLCFAAILPLWAAQWWLLSPPTERRTPGSMLAVVCMTSSVLNTTPMLVGEAAGVWFLASTAGVERAAGVAVLAMDQLLVGLAKVAVLAGASLTLPLPPAMRAGVRVLAAGVIALTAALLVVAWSGERTLQRLTGRLPARLASIARRGAAALAPLRSPLRGGGALLIALLKKGAELLAILAIQRAFGVDLPASSALVVLAALNLATLLPIVPGNAGVYEASVVLAYAWLGVPPERALGMAVVQHACYFVALALPGYRWLAAAAPRSAAAAR